MVYPSNIINTKYLIKFLQILHIFYPDGNNSKPNIVRTCSSKYVKQYLVLAVFQLPVTLHNKLLSILGIVFVSKTLSSQTAIIIIYEGGRWPVLLRRIRLK